MNPLPHSHTPILPHFPQACSLHTVVCTHEIVPMDENVRFVRISLKFIVITMEKRLFGVILTILGIAGLLLAAYNFVQGNTASNHSIRSVAMYGILGLLFFFAGIGLIRSTRDLTNRS